MPYWTILLLGRFLLERLLLERFLRLELLHLPRRVSWWFH